MFNVCVTVYITTRQYFDYIIKESKAYVLTNDFIMMQLSDVILFSYKARKIFYHFFFFFFFFVCLFFVLAVAFVWNIYDDGKFLYNKLLVGWSNADVYTVFYSCTV